MQERIDRLRKKSCHNGHQKEFLRSQHTSISNFHHMDTKELSKKMHQSVPIVFFGEKEYFHQLQETGRCNHAKRYIRRNHVTKTEQKNPKNV